MSSTMKEFELYTNKRDTMTKLRSMVSLGNYFYTAGQCPKKKFKALYYKFEDRYAINLERNKRYRAKKNGLCNTNLIAWLDKEKSVVNFWLLSTEGEGDIFAVENMQSCLKKNHRLTLHTNDYYLVKEPRPNDKARWTWKMTEEKYQDWTKAILVSIRHKNDFELKQIHYSLIRIPAFSAARKQGFALLKLMKNEWIRTRPSSEEFPFKTSYIGFMGRYKKADKPEIILL